VPARLAATGVPLDRLYERNWLQNEIRRAGIERLGYFAPNPPANALLLVPFAALGPRAAKAAWTATLALALVLSFLLLRRAAPAGASPWLLALAFLLQSTSLANALAFGPAYPLLLAALTGSLVALLAGHGLVAGLLLAPVVALKLYGAPFVLALALARRWRALLGFALGFAAIALGGVAALGWPVHEVYLREVMPASLSGELLDPYAPSRQSVASVGLRLLQREPELNPSPVADRPGLARGIVRGVSVLLLALGVLSCRAGSAGPRLRREWAALALAALAASPLTATYHLVLLALPVGLLVHEAEAQDSVRRALVPLALLAFASSFLPLAFGRFAAGWTNLAACPRLIALLALLAWALRGLLSPSRAALALAAGAAAGALALDAPREEPWQRIESARGFVQSEPALCGERLAWVTTSGERLVIQDSGGRTLSGAGDAFTPRCEGGELRFTSSSTPGSTADPTLAADQDRSRDGRLAVLVPRGEALLLERDEATGRPRMLAKGSIRRPRLSPDERWVAFQEWRAATGSWDVVALERASGQRVVVASGPSNEVEPSWSPDGEQLVFSSDRRRGLGFDAIYSVPFRRPTSDTR
jgi:MFS family permease